MCFHFIHNELNKRIGVVYSNTATESQLAKKLELGKKWFLQLNSSQ